MNLPRDPHILLSLINTKLRDYYKNLYTLCDDLDISEDKLCDDLGNIGYEYSEHYNSFIKSKVKYD